MATEITHIEAPEHWKSTNDWDSHREMLFLVLSQNKECHPICEFGSGEGSTGLLRKACEMNGIGFQSWETDLEWAKKTGSNFTESFKSVRLPMGYILFIDGKPGEERKDLIAIHKDKHVLIIHDTEHGANYVYGMADVLNSFKYRLDYRPEGKPHTTAVSNYINIEEWKSI